MEVCAIWRSWYSVVGRSDGFTGAGGGDLGAVGYWGREPDCEADSDEEKRTSEL